MQNSEQNPYSELSNKRQFIASSRPLPLFDYWKKAKLSGIDLHIYAQKDLEITSKSNGNNGAVLLGFITDSRNIQNSNEDILESILKYDSIESSLQYISDFGGRFVLILNIGDKQIVVNDACGLRSVYFLKTEEVTAIASQPLLLKQAYEIEQDPRFNEYEESCYKKTVLEDWLPSSYSSYKFTGHLMPNHYLSLDNCSQFRFWPFKKIEKNNLDDAAALSALELKNTISSAYSRFPLSLPITAGWESRLIMAASTDYLEEMYMYTLKYRDLDHNTPDIAVPAKMLPELGFQHHIIDCKKELDPDFWKIYSSSNYSSNEDWAQIAYGMLGQYPEDKICLKGNCAEIVTCSYYFNGRHKPIKSGIQVVEKVGWKGIPFIEELMEKWVKDLHEYQIQDYNVDILDLLYWEHRMGSWQARSQLEWDIVQEAFTPFNSRPVISAMLTAPIEKRVRFKYKLYQRMLENLNPQLLEWPINPVGKKEKIGRFIKKNFRDTLLYQKAKSIRKKTC